MTVWLVNITADTSSISLHEKNVRDKPAGLGDQCYLDPANPRYVTPGTCTHTLPDFGDSRMVAGGPLYDNVLKCQLRPVGLADYAVPFTGAQQALLASVRKDQARSPTSARLRGPGRSS